MPSPPLALFVVMLLPKAHLTLHSRMSGSRWVSAPSWLSGSWRSFLYSSVYSCYLFLISSVSVRSMPFLSLIVPIVAWNVPLVSPIFLKRSVVFPIPIVVLYFFALITEEGFLISPCSSLELYIQMGISFLFSLRLASLLFSAIWKASSDNILPFAFHFLRDGLAQCLLYYCLLITAFSTTHSWTKL